MNSRSAAFGEANPSASIAQLVSNVRGGLHLAFFRKVPRTQFHASPDQIALLALLNILTGLAWEWLFTPDPIEFYSGGVAVQMSCVVSVFLLAMLASREVRAPNAGFERTAVMLLSPMFVGWIGYAFIELGRRHSETFTAATEEWYLGLPFSCWIAFVYAHTIAEATDIPRHRSRSLAYVYGLLLYGALQSFPTSFLLYTGYTPSIDDFAEEEAIDAEAILHGQRTRVEATVAALQSQRPDVTDLYFVGFGSYASQDVFMKETKYVRDLMDRRFDTETRSLVLINNRDTVESTPLATASNLDDALRALSKKIDVEEDILFLYLTSHGSRSWELSVDFDPLPINNFGPDKIKSLLDKYGFQWRVVVVSSCYSGGYIDPIQDEQTLVLTSAAADRTSFGCGQDSDLTYFARAYFEEQLEHTRDLVGAFEAARVRLVDWETSEDKKPSNPQIALGELMKKKLAEWNAQFPAEPTIALAQAPIANP